MNNQPGLFDKPQPSFHNSIDLKGKELIKAESKAKTQEEIILKLFTDNPHVDFTASDVHLRLGQQMLLTSIRRSISNLVESNHLEKTENKRLGLYGQMNYAYKLRD